MTTEISMYIYDPSFITDSFFIVMKKSKENLIAVFAQKNMVLGGLESKKSRCVLYPAQNHICSQDF